MAPPAAIRKSPHSVVINPCHKSKNGDRRQVPLNGKARALLDRPWPALEAARRNGQLIPLWDGQLEPKALAATTARLSRMFANVFAEAGSEDLHFHDARRYLSLRGSELADILDCGRSVPAGVVDTIGIADV